MIFYYFSPLVKVRFSTIGQALPQNVRNKLGSLNTKRIANPKFQSFYKTKIDKVLQKHLLQGF